jgi:hypothetical protein
MTIRKSMKTALVFLAGFISGLLVLVVATTTAQDPTAGAVEIYSPVTVKNAKVLFQKYLTDAHPMSEIFRGFAISKPQFEAMKKISERNEGLSGFRIYPGKNSDGLMVGIVVGMNEAGKDDTIRPMFMTQGVNSGPCPTYCDQSSTITKP